MMRWLLLFAIGSMIARPAAADAALDQTSKPTVWSFDTVVAQQAAQPLHEPEPGVELISLDEAIERALVSHPRERVFAAEVAQAEARFEAARAESKPTLDFRYEHIWEDSHIRPGGVHDPLDLDSVMLIAAVPIVHPRAWANWSETKERVDVQEAEAASDRRELALSAARAWIDAAAAAHALAAEREGLRTANAHAVFVESRLGAGAAASLDLVRAQKEVALASARVKRARAVRLRAQEKLGLLTGSGHAVDADVQRDGPLGAPREAAELRVPEEISARHALRAAQHESHNMFTDYLPSLHVELLGFYQNHPQPVLPVTGTGYAAFLRLKLPLYDADREARRSERRAEELRAAAHLDDVTRIVAADLRDGESDVSELRDALDQTARAADLARNALSLTETRYASGAGTQLDVIDALRESRDLDIAVAAAEDRFRRAELDLLAARGHVPSYQQLRLQH